MIDGVAYLNASSVPTQDKCDDICSCIEGEVFCDKKVDCVSDDFDEDVTTQEPGVEETPVTTGQPDEEEPETITEQTDDFDSDVTTDQTDDFESDVTTDQTDDFESDVTTDQTDDFDSDVTPDQTDDFDSDETTLSPEGPVTELPEEVKEETTLEEELFEGEGLEEDLFEETVEEGAEFTTQTTIEEDSVATLEEDLFEGEKENATTLEEDLFEGDSLEEDLFEIETPETTLSPIEEDIDSEEPDTTETPSEVETDEDIVTELPVTTLPPTISETEDVAPVETEDVAPVETEDTDDFDETEVVTFRPDETEEEEVTTQTAIESLEEDLFEGDSLEEDLFAETNVTIVAPETSSEETTMIPETETDKTDEDEVDQDETDESIDEDMTTVPTVEELSIPVSEEPDTTEPPSEVETDEGVAPMETTGSPMENAQESETDTVVTTLGPEILPATTLPSIDEEDDTVTTLPPAPEEGSESDKVDAVDESDPMTTTEPPMPSTEKPIPSTEQPIPATEQPIPVTEQPEVPTTTVEEVEEIIPTTTPASVEEELEPEIEIEEGACLVNGTQYPDGATVPSDNACELCQCFSGDVICPIQECPPAPAGCTALPVPEGKCCPDYSCPVAQPDEDEILDDDDDVPEEDILQKVTSSFEDETQESILLPERKPQPLASVSEAPTYPPDFGIEDDVEKSTTDPLIGTGSSAVLDDSFSTTAAPDIDEYEYEDELTLDSIGPGACLFEGKVYVSAQQIPRTNPCDFCFCFRGDIICLQQSCPPPIPGCREEAISGFCCPRYECPVKGGVQNVTLPAPSEPSISSWLFGSDQEPEQPGEMITQQISGCEVQGHFYEVGAIVESSSGPCLQCR